MVKRSKDSPPYNPPRFVLMGRQEPATYIDQEIANYRGNPLIEALPPIWTRDEVDHKLARYPSYSDDERNLPSHLRYHLIGNSQQFFIPQGIHFEIEIRMSCLVRGGYEQRNPLAFGYWPDLGRRLGSLHSSDSKFLPVSKARGYATVGHSGMGKTTVTETILLLYPQVISHSEYKGQNLILKQLVWLKLDCPQDGSIKGLCINFFEAVDAILGTDYYRNYAHGRSTTVDLLLPRMARVAALHSLGVIVIDEIQNLSTAKSGGACQMLSFFVQLENTIGVPFILVGTQQALSLFKGEFRQARRLSEQGDVVWDRMRELAERTSNDGDDKADPQWEAFVRALFTYDYLREPSLLKSDLLKDTVARALYNESQGITAVAATIYMLAQRRAITSGLEKMTVGIIRSAARDGQHLVRTMLEELRAGKRQVTYKETAKDLFDVKQNPPERKPEVLIPQPDSGEAEEKVAKPPELIGKDPKQSKASSAKRRPNSDNKKKLEGRSPQPYDFDDLRNLASQNETTSSRPKHRRLLAR